MAYYNQRVEEKTHSRTIFERAHKIELHNALNTMPQLTMRTSWVAIDNVTGAVEQLEGYRTLVENFTPGKVITKRGTDGSVTGTVTHEEFMEILYGLFYDVAAEADA